MKSISISSTPTCISRCKSSIYIGTKAGDIFVLEGETKKRILKESSSISSITSVKDLLIYGTKKGEIKAWNEKGTTKLSNRHKQIITSFSVTNNNEDIDIYTASADKKISHWKLILENQKTKRPQLIFLNSLYGPNTPIISSSINEQFLLCTSELSSTIRLFKLDKDTQLIFNIPLEYAVIAEFLNNSFFTVISSDGTLYLFSVEEESPLSSYSTGISSYPTILKKIKENELLLGFSCGTIIILSINHHSTGHNATGHHAFTPITTTSCAFIPNDVLLNAANCSTNCSTASTTNCSTASTTNCSTVGMAGICVIGGKEEKHNRFLINKEFSNCLMYLPQ
ncbi:hypothetical protein NEFER03_0701 [Nematocida sp. LUAm3]|nr:hypothetical protein NEFER03_0701 [Nematocida sp. LUAm3]KAI5175160.1 hypothetical protein NEFER02_1121 [Nematocida sp. LUAm2]KAI5178168.1 hypothetical protein NEFER01_1346 [Nematocida sp. LUAm1]